MLTRSQRRRNQAVIRRHPAIWAAWLAACDAIHGDAADVDGEELAAWIAMFHRLRREGMEFDAGFVAEVYAVQLAMMNVGNLDSDNDTSVDDGFEDDTVDDRDDADEIGGNLGNDPSPLHWWRKIQSERSEKTKSPDDQPILAEEPATGLTH